VISLLLLAGLAAAAPAPAAAPGGTAVEWLRVYSTAPYQEIWSMRLEVRSLKNDLPKVIAALEKSGAKSSVPLENSVVSNTEGSQQLSFRGTVAQAQAALKGLKKAGKLDAPVVRGGDKIPLDEIKTKITQLARDKDERGAELAKMPAVRALVETVLAHLITAKQAAEADQGLAIMNLTVVEKAAAKK
jgi:hypothetical protein